MSESSTHDGNRLWPTSGIDATALQALARGLPPTELWSLLLRVVEQRAADRTVSTLQQQWQQDRFVAPCAVDQRTLQRIDTELLAAAAAFEAIELSPLAPLGICSSIALTTQNRIVSTARGTEVVSDPTNVLALECAQRLRRNPDQVVRLATSHRCTRAQPIPKRPGFAAHFRMFCLASAAHEVADQAFTVDAMVEQIRTHLAALERLEQTGYRFPDRSVTLLATGQRRPLAQRIAAELESVRVVHESLTHSYYDGLRFMINAGATAGEKIPLIDGGAFDWVAKLASNRKLVFVASGLGSQILPGLFAAAAADATG
jgi:hypothetical protein